MPKKSVFLLTLLSLLYSNVSYATVTMRVDVDGLKTACDGKPATAPDFSLDWSVACNGITIRGLAACGVELGDSGFIALSSRVYRNKVCFCKIIHPIIKEWALGKEFSSEVTDPNETAAHVPALNCDKTCAQVCADKLKDLLNL